MVEKIKDCFKTLEENKGLLIISMVIAIAVIALIIFVSLPVEIPAAIGATIAASAQLLLGTLAELLPKIPITA